MRRVPLLPVLALGTLVPALVCAAPHASTPLQPELDVSLAAPTTAVSAAARQAVQGLHSRAGHASVVDKRLGATFLWADRSATAAAAAAPANAQGFERLARNALVQHASTLRISSRTVGNARLHEVHDTGRGPVIARFQQQVEGVDVFGRTLNVAMTRAGQVVAVSGYFSPDSGVASLQASSTARFAHSAAQAVALAAADLGVAPTAFSAAGTHGAYQHFQAQATAAVATQPWHLTHAPRAKPVYFPLGDQLEPAYYVEVMAQHATLGTPADYAYIISARTGQVLKRHNLQADFSYRVHADQDGTPYDSPIGNTFIPYNGASPKGTLTPDQPIARRLVSLRSSPLISTGDPWLPAGATTPLGNNVNAYLNLGGRDAYEAATDLRPTLTSPKTFDYAPTSTDGPTSTVARNAAVVSLFYLNNWLHDFWYDRGFNEAAGNAQRNNLGRGGVEGDPVIAQGQDVSGRNNANMSTPADGSSPRMRMYVWDNPGSQPLVELVAPSSVAGRLTSSTAVFGSQNYSLQAKVRLAPASNRDGCATFSSTMTGLIALIERGTCTFVVKTQHAQAAGAAGVIITNNVPGGGVVTMSGEDPSLTIPVQMVTYEAGQSIRSAGSTVTAKMSYTPLADMDGTIDASIVAHEYFHHVSNRLVGDANGLTNNQGGSMGEGWSDLSALLLHARPSDLSNAYNANWSGAYAVGSYVMRDNYYGIRRYPYSTDMSKNPLTFKHIANGQALPGTVAPGFDTTGSDNAEVHNSGEVWALMLWEAYVGFLNDGRYTFEQARAKVQDYVIAGLKLTPINPTMVEARNAILAAADATDDQDFTLWATAFAKRGMGVGAVAPARNSTTHSGVVESYVVATPTP